MQYGTYCGTALIYYLSQISGAQLKTIGSDAVLLNFLGTLIPQAEKIVDGYCNHSFGTPSYGTMYFDGNGKDTLFLPPKYCPMIGIGGGSIDSSAISITNLKVYDTYLRYISTNFIEGKQNVVLYGSYGYLTMPKDVEYVTAQLCANILMDMVRRNVAPDLMVQLFRSANAGEGDVSALFSQPTVFNPNLQKMLNPYVIQWTEIG